MKVVKETVSAILSFSRCIHVKNQEIALSADTKKKPIVLVVGTRPEGIKMIPVYRALQRAGVPVLLCSTMQHDELLTQVFDLFGVKPDHDLRIMRHGQDLFYVTQAILQKTKELFSHIKPAAVLVHGDTSTTMAAALSAFYLRIPVGHVEAGLRTDDIHVPFPEEMNRRVVGTIADLHFSPTAHAAAQLLAEGVERKKLFCVGNTVVDALHMVQEKINNLEIKIDPEVDAVVSAAKASNKRLMLLTVHRREAFNGGVVEILQTVKDFLLQHEDVFCFYPYHPNPHVVSAIQEVGLSALPNIFLSEPVSYAELVHVLFNADVVVTDSGGIQEEGVSLGKPVLVLREKTERAEGVWAGCATLVGMDGEKIKKALTAALTEKKSDLKKSLSVYGDGYASDRIAQIVKDHFMVFQEEPSFIPEKISQKTAIPERKTPMKTVSVLGLGYIGLPTSIVMAQAGLNVVGFDIDNARVDAINAGDPVIQEPEIFEKLQLVLGSGNFRATTDLEPADYFMVAVPTPFLLRPPASGFEGQVDTTNSSEKPKAFSADLSYVFAAADSIAAVLQKGNTVLLESTVSVGATEKLANYLAEKTGMVAGTDFFVAHCPERVLPGKIFQELVYNDRIIGGIDRKSVEKSKELYQRFVEGKLFLTDAKTAEMVKLVENSSRDVEIAFAHQVASMASSVGLDPYTVIELANKHPRVNILRPSAGVGGHCIAVDPWFLAESFPQHSELIKTARIVNDNRPKEIVAQIQKTLPSFDKPANVLLLGLTYKPNVDDLRESPALEIAKTLCQDKKNNYFVCEPHLNKEKLKKLFPNNVISVQEGVAKADVVVYLVAHTRFKAIDEKLLQNKQVLDFCGICHQPQKVKEGKEALFFPAFELMEEVVVETKPEHIIEESSL